MIRNIEQPPLCSPIQQAIYAVQAEYRRPSRYLHKAPPGECTYCDRERSYNNNFHPSHNASPNCRSGGHNHCSCDTCF